MNEYIVDLIYLWSQKVQTKMIFFKKQTACILNTQGSETL